MDDTNTIHGEVVTTTENAILLKLFPDDEIWIPRSCIEGGEDMCDFCDDSTFEVATWFCEQEGI